VTGIKTSFVSLGETFETFKSKEELGDVKYAKVEGKGVSAVQSKEGTSLFCAIKGRYFFILCNQERALLY
jgi:hypothetical protein